MLSQSPSAAIGSSKSKGKNNQSRNQRLESSLSTGNVKDKN